MIILDGYATMEETSLPHVNAELFDDEANDVGRQHLHVGLHAHRFQFFHEGKIVEKGNSIAYRMRAVRTRLPLTAAVTRHLSPALSETDWPTSVGAT